MGLSASQGRMLLLTARRSDLEFRAQQISQKRLLLAQQLEEISMEYENATSNRQMNIVLYQTDPSGSGQKVVSSANLTYATLMSGTYSTLSSSQSGVNPPANGTYTDGSPASNKAYRLVDAEGAIVISDLSEIQNTVAYTYVEEQDSQPYVYKNAQGADVTKLNNLYAQRTIESDQITGVKSSAINNYVFVPEQGSALQQFMGDENAVINIDPKNQIAQVTTKDASGKAVTRYFNLVDNSEYLKEEVAGSTIKQVPYMPDEFDKDMVIEDVKLSDVPPKDKINGTAYENLAIDDGTGNGGNLKKGQDGKYTLYDNDGSVIARYVLDEGLAYGSTDTAGSVNAPNYLQDCLRNGKYLLQQGNGVDSNGNYVWSSISWDATTNISDSYYTEDDDAAKAKYDRLQAQIQNQDKKLEMELDAIETQRQAVTTEEESVQKVIDENIEGSFKAFA